MIKPNYSEIYARAVVFASLIALIVFGFGCAYTKQEYDRKVESSLSEYESGIESYIEACIERYEAKENRLPNQAELNYHLTQKTNNFYWKNKACTFANALVFTDFSSENGVGTLYADTFDKVTGIVDIKDKSDGTVESFYYYYYMSDFTEAEIETIEDEIRDEWDISDLSNVSVCNLRNSSNENDGIKFFSPWVNEISCFSKIEEKWKDIDFSSGERDTYVYRANRMSGIDNEYTIERDENGKYYPMLMGRSSARVGGVYNTNDETMFEFYIYDCSDFLRDTIVALVWEGLLLLLIFNAIGFAIAYGICAKKKAEYSNYTMTKSLTKAMAHDLKTPLMVISGYAENALNTDNPEKMNQFIGEIINGTDRMNATIQSMLALLKSEDDIISMPKSQVNVADLVRGIVSDYERNAQFCNLTLKVKSLEEVMWETNSEIMREIVVNLVDNAIKYAGGPEEADHIIELIVDEDKIEVRNSFEGTIDFKDADEIKKPYVKGDSSRNTKGNGLGLSIADNLAEGMGGKLEVKWSNTEHSFKAAVYK